jgi:hypothetical protein
VVRQADNRAVRVSPPRVFPAAAPAPRPPAGDPATDAHRQAGFVLGGEIDLAVRGLELEGAVAAASSDAKHRSQGLAAALGPWSRSWLTRLSALHACQWGNYAAVAPLVRSAADYLGAGLALLDSAAAEWSEWLEAGGIAAAHADHATEFVLHPFRSGETLAAHEGLGAVYREATDLALPHFGSTLLLAGSESSPERVAMTFGDRAFHLGLAEIALGWLLRLGAVQVETLLGHAEVFGLPDAAALERWAAAAREGAARNDRCRLEAVERTGVPRWLVTNWRREPRSPARRMLL